MLRPSGCNRSPAAGNPGDVEPVGEALWELRINHGPGYRVYFKRREQELIIRLAGGDKRTQAKEIKTALHLAQPSGVPISAMVQPDEAKVGSCRNKISHPVNPQGI